MQTVTTIPNSMPEVQTTITHELSLPRLCPATGNPQPGSEIRISYSPAALLLDVFGLEALLAGYVGHTEIRDIEYMVQHLTQRCADALAVEVQAEAGVLLDLGQRLTIATRARPV